MVYLCCKNKIPMTLIIIFLFLQCLTSLAAQQQNQDIISIRTNYLKINFVPGDGLFTLYTLKDDSETEYQTEAPGLKLNNIYQKNFKVISGQPLVLQNQSLRLSLQVIDENSISVEWKTEDDSLQQFELHLKSDDETEYYGMGERFNSLNQRGYILPNVTDDRYGNKGVGTHKPVPFFMSNRGLGVWVDSYSPGIFDLNGSERFETRIRFKENKFRVVFIGGEKLTDILKAFTRLTGRPALPPPWAFGLWKSRDVHHNQDSVYTDIIKLRRYKIPASVLVIDSPWETGYNNFKVNTRQFNEPDSMFNRIEELGFNLCLWLTPFVNKENVIDMKGIENESDNFSEAARKGFLIKEKTGNVALSDWWKGKGGLVDFTNPNAVEWWYNEMKRMLDYGVKAFKCDDGEGNFVPDAVFYDGSSSYKMKNRYAFLYDSVMQGFIDKYLDSNGVLITRSGYTGFQKFPFAWAGDNDADFSFANGLPSVIVAGQNAALSGISLWGTDIAGYAGTPTKELFIRWTQFAVFCPFMQIHMTSNLGPWDFGEDALDIFRKYAVLRMQLFPYLYNAVHEAVETGLPVIRPMALAFQNDAEAVKNIYQFMFGPDILVAPIYQPGNHRIVYLPESSWIDFWNGKTINGKQYTEVEAPLDKIPLYIRAGSIIPLLPDDIQTLVSQNPKMNDSIKAIDDRRILQVWPGEEGSLNTYEGISAELLLQNDSYQLEFSSETERPLVIEIINSKLNYLKVDNASVYYNERTNKTVVSYLSFSGKEVIKWEAAVK
jgi:alpha-D-xyloside xylohydrolase